MNSKFSLCRCRRDAQDEMQPNGFTLMELLIVIAIILILMLMAIPTIGSLKKSANRTSAIQSVRAIQQAEMQYESTYPANGYACALPDLGLQIRLHLRHRQLHQGDGRRNGQNHGLLGHRGSADRG